MKLNPNERRYIIHHSDSDGTCAAMIFKIMHPWRDAEVICTTYGKPFPESIVLDENTHIAIVDFSYSRQILEKVNEKVGSLVVLDHHDVAEEELKGLPYVVFSKTKAGAGMAWEYLFPEAPVPGLVKFVDDYDLWQKKYPESKYLEHAARASGQQLNVEYWYRMYCNPNEMRRNIEFGFSISNSIKSICRDIVDKKRFAVVDLEKTSTKLQHIAAKMAFLNLTEYLNDVPEAIYEARDDIDFVMTYRFQPEDGRLKLSLRSRHDKPLSVAFVARHLGGNGRQNTAGVVMPAEEGLIFLNKLYEAARNEQ